MDEDELRQIREARLRELRGQNPGAGSSPASDKKDDMRGSILPQLLTQDARERLNRIRIVKPERADQVEQVIIRMGQTGQLAQKVGERELVSLLDQMAKVDQSANKIVINRRETEFDREDHTTSAHMNSAPASKGAGEDSDDDFFD